MAARTRRPKGQETVQLHMFVRPDVRQRIQTLAEAHGVPQWAILEAAVMVGAEHGDMIPEAWDVKTPNGDPLPIDLKKTA